MRARRHLRLSRFDHLTGLYSRSFFTSTVEREIQRAARTGRPFAMLMFDLDGLKAANDRFGHDSGDRLLQAVADVLRGDIRVTDVAARYAGDEFVLLLPETDLAGALRVAEKLRVDISRLALSNNGSLMRTSASIGLVTYFEDGRTWAELIRRADLAMYEAKRRGRDQIVHYARHPAAQAGNGSQHGAYGPAVTGPVNGPPVIGQPVNGPPANGPPANGPPVMALPVTVSPAPPRPQPQPPPRRAPAVPPESPRPAPWESRGG